MLEKDKRKNSRKTILISAVSLGLVAVIIGVLMIVRYCVPKNPNPNIKKDQLILYTPALIKEETSLKDGELKLEGKDGDNKYFCVLSINNDGGNAQIPPYSNPTYLYRSYGHNPNQVVMSVTFYTITESGTRGSVYTDYEDLAYIVYVGNSESHSLLPESSYSVNNGILTYTSDADIFVYSVDVTVKI